MDETKRVALITGAARGIGAATSRLFATSGYRVAAIDIHRDEVAELVDKINTDGGDAISFAADLADLGKLETIVADLAARWGQIDVLINNAADRNLESVRTLTPAGWNRILAVNLTAPAFLTKWVTPHMRRTNARPSGGVIINLSSVEANIPKGVAAAYAVTKGGMLSLSYESAASLASLGIRVIALSPGAIDTAFGADYDEVTQGSDSSLEKNYRYESEQIIPMQRWGAPSEIAEAALWLASNAASYVTGTEIRVDGGMTHTWMPHRVKRQILPDEFE